MAVIEIYFVTTTASRHHLLSSVLPACAAGWGGMNLTFPDVTCVHKWILKERRTVNIFFLFPFFFFKSNCRWNFHSRKTCKTAKRRRFWQICCSWPPQYIFIRLPHDPIRPWLHEPVVRKSSQSNANIRVRLDKSALAFPRSPSSPRFPGRDVAAAAGLPFIPRSRARNSQREGVHYLDIVDPPPASPPTLLQQGKKKQENLRLEPKTPALALRNAADYKVNESYSARWQKAKKWSIKLGAGGGGHFTEVITYPNTDISEL